MREVGAYLVLLYFHSGFPPVVNFGRIFEPEGKTKTGLRFDG